MKTKDRNLDLIVQPSLTDDDVWLFIDETKLVQVISNLISNALKFTKQGHIRFGYRLITLENGENMFEFFVEDTGIGIPAEMHEEIFKRFRQVENTATRKFGGSGLGLSITKAYIQLLGGDIWLKSEAGMGSTFFFSLPFKKLHN